MEGREPLPEWKVDGYRAFLELLEEIHEHPMGLSVQEVVDMFRPRLDALGKRGTLRERLGFVRAPREWRVVLRRWGSRGLIWEKVRPYGSDERRARVAYEPFSLVLPVPELFPSIPPDWPTSAWLQRSSGDVREAWDLVAGCSR